MPRTTDLNNKPPLGTMIGKRLKEIGRQQKWLAQEARISKNYLCNIMNGRAICWAEARIRTPFRHTSEEDCIRAAKEEKNARAIIAKYKPTREMDIHEIMARNQLMEKTFTETREPDVVEYIVPQATENTAILKAIDHTETIRRIRKEESVSAALFDFYQKQA